MTKDGWKSVIKQAVQDEKELDLLAICLEQLDQAKQELRNKGYGWTGLDILKTVELVPENK